MSLDPRRFVANEYVNTDWTLTVEAGTSLEDVANPAFLANVSQQLHQYDQIRVRIDTGEWYAVLLVVDCDRNWAKTVVLLKKELAKDDVEKAPEIDSQYDVKHLGPHRKWCVIRKADKEAIKEECTTRQDANLWLSQHIMSL